MAFGKDIDNIVIDDLKALIENEVAESKTIEYKIELPNNTRDSKKEFLADVSSFANASGGFLFYGIKENRGIPCELSGLGKINADAEILRLENLVRDNIEPRIPSISMRNIPLESGDSVIIVHIPRSWAQPHVVNFSGHWRFYTRNSAGKYPLDISELRTAFSLSETISQRVRLFRTERLSKIVSGEAPVSLAGSAFTVLHVIPLISFDMPTTIYNLAGLERDTGILQPLGSNGWSHRVNFDGLLTYTPTLETMSPMSYLQIFRNGIIEAVDERLLRRNKEDRKPYIPSVLFERAILEALPRFVKILKRSDISPPVFIMLSLLGVSGYVMAVRGRGFSHGDTPIDRDALIVPEVLVENFELNPDELMKPVFDAIWNAAGWPRSLNYDNDGKWVDHP